MRALLLVCVAAAVLFATRPAPANAQLVRCEDRVYRDARDCPGARKPGTVTYPDTRPVPPTPAVAPMVPAAQYDAMRGAAPTGKSEETPPECKFRYFTLGDDKGKVLAANAKQECIRNKALKSNGQAGRVTYEAYMLWKDHFEVENNRRQQALNRSNAANAANAAANRPNPGMRCTPAFSIQGGYDCK